MLRSEFFRKTRSGTVPRFGFFPGFLDKGYNIFSLALIGKGSFSKVLRASHRATGQKYAIKMIEKLSHESKESCDKELRVLRRTRHQNIIQLIEIYEGKCTQASTGRRRP